MINERIINLIFHPKNSWTPVAGKNEIFFSFEESCQKIKALDIDNFLKEMGIREEQLKISSEEGLVGIWEIDTCVTIKISHNLFAVKIEPIRDFYEELFKYKTPESLSKRLNIIPDDKFLTKQAREMLKQTAFYRLERMKQRPGSNQFIG